MEILTVCTGNICRSPLAEAVLERRLGDIGVHVSSAGVHGLRDAPMTPEAARIAIAQDAAAETVAAHRSRRLTPAMLSTPDLILAMTRAHRRDILALAPGRLRVTFTVREFARLAAHLSDDDLRAAASGAGDASARLRATASHLAAQRGAVVAPADERDDDVIDPYLQSAAVYDRSTAQMMPGLEQVERVVRLAFSAP
jgi:protein-tyrosine phosphatase